MNSRGFRPLLRRCLEAEVASSSMGGVASQKPGPFRRARLPQSRHRHRRPRAARHQHLRGTKRILDYQHRDPKADILPSCSCHPFCPNIFLLFVLCLLFVVSMLSGRGVWSPRTAPLAFSCPQAETAAFSSAAARNAARRSMQQPHPDHIESPLPAWKPQPSGLEALWI